jgi:hypothetical protein
VTAASGREKLILPYLNKAIFTFRRGVGGAGKKSFENFA